MAKISGVLTDGAGNIINNCTIELYAKKTTSKVLTQTQAFQVANNGSYTMNVLPCDYDVKLIINGFPPKKLGAIQVFSDSKDGTLNDFLLNPLESEITPEILQQVIDARNHANKSSEKASDSERNSKTSETNAKVSADNAKASENNAFNSAQSASESATTATNANSSAKSYSDLAKSYADSASSSATESRNSAEQSSNSANAAKVSEDKAKTSEQNAKKSADDAKNWASTIDNSNFIKKTGEENQSINGSLDVKKLTEQGQRVYSPNNKPTADDIGTVPAIKEVVNDSPIYKVGAHIVVKDMIGDQ
uniref:prophage tail fiber N-terminal domain-containing protein n=1 Tax=Gilliamella bombi TaxID=1908521 RepID=UPI001ABEF473